MSRLPPIKPAPPPVRARPICPFCAKPLRPWIDTDTDYGNYSKDASIVTARRWTGSYHGYGPFDRQACATNYAIRMHSRHGTQFWPEKKT